MSKTIKHVYKTILNNKFTDPMSTMLPGGSVLLSFKHNPSFNKYYRITLDPIPSKAISKEVKKLYSLFHGFHGHGLYSYIFPPIGKILKDGSVKVSWSMSHFAEDRDEHLYLKPIKGE